MPVRADAPLRASASLAPLWTLLGVVVGSGLTLASGEVSQRRQDVFARAPVPVSIPATETIGPPAPVATATSDPAKDSPQKSSLEVEALFQAPNAPTTSGKNPRKKATGYRPASLPGWNPSGLGRLPSVGPVSFSGEDFASEPDLEVRPVQPIVVSQPPAAPTVPADDATRQELTRLKTRKAELLSKWYEDAKPVKAVTRQIEELERSSRSSPADESYIKVYPAAPE